MAFQILPLTHNQFAGLEALPPSQVLRMRVDTKPGFPCRISLADAEIGEDVLLVHFEHQPADSPFRASHAVYIRPGAAQARPAVNEVPPMLQSRVLSLRAFDSNGIMLNADLAEGDAIAPAIDRLLAAPTVDYLHLHFAKPGCYAARAERRDTLPA